MCPWMINGDAVVRMTAVPDHRQLMEPTGSDLLLNSDRVHRNMTNDEVKADGQRSGKCSVCLIGGIKHG